MKRLPTIILGLLTAVYPLVVYFSLTQISPRAWGGILLALWAMRWWMGRNSNAAKHSIWAAIAAGIASLWMLIGNSETALRAYPVLINVALAAVFAWSLRYPPPIIERLARLQEPDLPPEGVIYTRKVTGVWLGFFIINGSIAIYTTWWSSIETWTLYNGFISYLLMGTLFVTEWLVRQHVKRRAAT